MGMTMRWLILTILLIAASCGSPNPEFCCVTEEQCAAAGVTDELRPCELGQACNPSNQCVAKECETSLDCTSPDRPTCQNNLCVEGCVLDNDCLGVPGAPHCNPNGECVGCLSNDQCPLEAEICDTDTRACRGCLRDEDCGDGVCIEATGACVSPENAIYVAAGGVDTADCPKPTPCGSLQFALGRVTSVRNVIKIVTQSLNPANTSVSLDAPVTIDGNGNTRIALRGNPGIDVTSVGTLIEGVSLRYEGSGNFITIADGAQSTLFSVELEENGLGTIGIDGELSVLRSLIQRNHTVQCNLGKLSVRESKISDSVIETTGCSLEISRSHLIRGATSAFGPNLLTSSGGLATIENNLIVQTEVGASSLSMSGHVTGSVFSFNTVVHTTTTSGSTTGISCSGIQLTSNIIAYNTSLPLFGDCSARHTLFDLAAGTQGGEGNETADAATFFVDRVAGDYHLAPNSPANSLGEPGLLDVDLDGNPRPATDPDSGAFEAP